MGTEPHLGSKLHRDHLRGVDLIVYTVQLVSVAVVPNRTCSVRCPAIATDAQLKRELAELAKAKQLYGLLVPTSTRTKTTLLSVARERSALVCTFVRGHIDTHARGDRSPGVGRVSSFSPQRDHSPALRVKANRHFQLS